MTRKIPFLPEPVSLVELGRHRATALEALSERHHDGVRRERMAFMKIAC